MMHVVCVYCSWSGPQPEKSSEETTSLGMSSLPASDGCNRPARPPGQSPEIGSPAGLAHSVSASVCPMEPGDPEAVKASTAFRTTSERKEHLPLQDPPSCASPAASAPADHGRTMPSQNSPQEATVTDDLETPAAGRSTQGLDAHLLSRQEVSVTTPGMQEPQTSLRERGWHPEHPNLSQSGLHEEPGNGQQEAVQQDVPRDQEHPRDREGLELLRERPQNPPESAGVEAAIRGDGVQQNVGPPGAQNSPPSGGFACSNSNSETLMEVDMAEQPLPAEPGLAGRQLASIQDTGTSDLPLDNPLMEVETSKCSPTSEILSSSMSTQNLQLRESSVEIPGTDRDRGARSSSVGLCGRCQPSVDSTEGSRSSITAALKELQGLLVTSSKPASENASEEAPCQSETETEGQAGFGVFSERWIQSKQHSQVSFQQTTSVSVKTDRQAGASAGMGAGGRKNTNFRGLAGGLVTGGEGVPKSREPVNESSPTSLASAETSGQLHCAIGVDVSPKHSDSEGDAPSPNSEQPKSLLSGSVSVQDLGRAAQNPGTDGPDTTGNICPEAPGPAVEFEPRTSCPPPSPLVLPPSLFPTADVDRLLRAGFTLQEALGALQQVGGNADLALLILLAKNIVVPT